MSSGEEQGKKRETDRQTEVKSEREAEVKCV